jgi:hypothetical protein
VSSAIRTVLAVAGVVVIKGESSHRMYRNSECFPLERVAEFIRFSL